MRRDGKTGMAIRPNQQPRPDCASHFPSQREAVNSTGQRNGVVEPRYRVLTHQRHSWPVIQRTSNPVQAVLADD